MLGPVFQIIALLCGVWDSFRLAEPENDLTFTREFLQEGGGREREEVAISDTVAHSGPDDISIDDRPPMPIAQDATAIGRLTLKLPQLV